MEIFILVAQFAGVAALAAAAGYSGGALVVWLGARLSRHRRDAEARFSDLCADTGSQKVRIGKLEEDVERLNSILSQTRSEFFELREALRRDAQEEAPPDGGGNWPCRPGTL